MTSISAHHFFFGAGRKKLIIPFFTKSKIIYTHPTSTLKGKKKPEHQKTQRDPPLHGPLHPKPISTNDRVSRADPMIGGMALDEPASSNIGLVGVNWRMVSNSQKWYAYQTSKICWNCRILLVETTTTSLGKLRLLMAFRSMSYRVLFFLTSDGWLADVIPKVCHTCTCFVAEQTMLPQIGASKMAAMGKWSLGFSAFGSPLAAESGSASLQFEWWFRFLFVEKSSERIRKIGMLW